jgi:hypothetical protein
MFRIIALRNPDPAPDFFMGVACGYPSLANPKIYRFSILMVTHY